MGMGMSGQGPGRYRAMSEINVTPMVDIMLVLLIIFMVVAPLMKQGVEIDLPEENTAPLPADQEPLVVNVASDGTLSMEDHVLTVDQVTDKVIAIRKANPMLTIFVRGDRRAAYGTIMHVMAQLQRAGITRVGLVTKPL